MWGPQWRIRAGLSCRTTPHLTVGGASTREHCYWISGTHTENHRQLYCPQQIAWLNRGVVCAPLATGGRSLVSLHKVEKKHVLASEKASQESFSGQQKTHMTSENTRLLLFSTFFNQTLSDLLRFLSEKVPNKHNILKVWDQRSRSLQLRWSWKALVCCLIPAICYQIVTSSENGGPWEAIIPWGY